MLIYFPQQKIYEKNQLNRNDLMKKKTELYESKMKTSKPMSLSRIENGMCIKFSNYFVK